MSRRFLCFLSMCILFALTRPATAAPVADPRSGDWCSVLPVVQGERALRNGPRFGPGPRHRILYLRSTGGNYQPGTDDSAQNTSSIISFTGNIGRTVPAFEGTGADWQEIIACVRRMYSPFAIEVTDVEPPADVDYVESVVGGIPEDIGYANAWGVSSGSDSQCTVMERGVNFNFSKAVPSFVGRNEVICEIIAQESAHNYALDHAYDCRDPMTYLSPCGQKSFMDVDAQCGEYAPRGCNCGGSTQNSYQILLGIFGPADDVVPQVSITDPADGATVKPGFSITAAPTDDVRVDRVEFFVDGTLVGTRSTAPYTTTVPLDWPIGALVIEAHAVDGGENVTVASINLTLVPECLNSSECDPGFECMNDRCLGGVGESCALQDECASGQCFFDPVTEDRFCTISCSEGGSECPSGFDCADSGFGSLKCLPALDAGGCCSTTAQSQGPVGGSLVLFALGLGLAVIGRRRRR